MKLTYNLPCFSCYFKFYFLSIILLYPWTQDKFLLLCCECIPHNIMVTTDVHKKDSLFIHILLYGQMPMTSDNISILLFSIVTVWYLSLFSNYSFIFSIARCLWDYPFLNLTEYMNKSQYSRRWCFGLCLPKKKFKMHRRE